MAWSDVILHGMLFFVVFTDQPRNPWQMLVEPLGSADPRLKITELHLNGIHGEILSWIEFFLSCQQHLYYLMELSQNTLQ